MYPNHEDFLEYWRNREVKLDEMKHREGWLNNLQKDLGDDFDVVTPSMPTADDAKYDEWKLWFERIMDVLEGPVILVGHSLGAMFLSKYLSENPIDQEIPGLLLVAGRYDTPERAEYPITSFTLKESLAKLTERAGKVVFFHSEDDPVVPYESFEQYQKEVPDADFRSFADRGHFLQPIFSEILDEIRSL
jgi:predicted alpha/beta hydrolase family esterase